MISNYETVISELPDEKKAELLEAAYEYNAQHTRNVIMDAFDEENEYVPFVVEYPKEGPMDPESSLRRMYGLLSLSRDMDRAFRQLDQAAKKLKVMKIRSWLLVNAKCDGAVYVDSDYGISCQGTIQVMPDVDMPDVIAEGLAKGQQ
jgi:hypothetical protein